MARSYREALAVVYSLCCTVESRLYSVANLSMGNYALAGTDSRAAPMKSQHCASVDISTGGGSPKQSSGRALLVALCSLRNEQLLRSQSFRWGKTIIPSSKDGLRLTVRTLIKTLWAVERPKE